MPEIIDLAKYDPDLSDDFEILSAVESCPRCGFQMPRKYMAYPSFHHPLCMKLNEIESERPH